MGKVKIVTDSTADLSKERIEQYDIEVVPLSVTIDGQSYLDRVDIMPGEYVKKLKVAKELPKTSQPAVGTFVDVYERLGQDGSPIISIHLSGGLSGTVGSANSAAQSTDVDVSVVESNYITTALSFQVLEAGKMAQDGADVQSILKRLEDIKNKTSLYLMVDTLDYLLKGGRIGRARALVGSLLNIKPMTLLEDGALTPVGKVRTHKKMIQYMTNKFTEETNGKTIKGVGIAHVDAYELAESLKLAIQPLSDGVEISIVETTPVISTHVGPGTVALMYYTD